MIRKLTSGIYSYSAPGYRVVRKAEQIVREEMDKAGRRKFICRWCNRQSFGKSLVSVGCITERTVGDFCDRYRPWSYCLGPTHEEVITDLVRNDAKTYRQLPLNLYQIQTKSA